MISKDFIALIYPYAKTSSVYTEIPYGFTIAEAALESGWGESMLFKEAMNLFGVKADSSWNGELLSMNTKEFINGAWVTIPAKWRKYSNLQDCIDDHSQFLIQNPRYKDCFQYTSSSDFAIAVAKAGYATDPDYSDKLCSIIEKYDLDGLMNFE